jgi:hypothetical protein
VHFTQTDNGFSTWTTPALLQYVGCGDVEQSADPMVASSRTTGDLWAGALSIRGLAGRGFFVNRWRADQSIRQLDGPWAVQCRMQSDKGMLDCGPRRDQPNQEALVLVATAGTELTCQFPWRRLVGAQSLDSTGQLWPATSPHFDIRRSGGSSCDEFGHGGMPVVIQAGVLQQGRIAVAFPRWMPNLPGQNASDPAATSVIISDSDGATWAQPVDFDELEIQGQPQAIHPPSAANVAASSSFMARFFPSIATDPNDPNRVAVAFVGSPQPVNHNTSRNLDIYIALSVDAGSTWSPQNIRRIDDSLVDAPYHFDDVQPSVAFDGYGGINVLYYAIDNNGLVTPRFVRLSSLTATPFRAALGASFDPVLYTGAPTFLGDYPMVAGGNCTMYPFWSGIIEDPVTGQMRYAVFVNRVRICDADADESDAVNASDVFAYTMQYLAQDARADLNRDGVVDVLDLDRFNQAYICGCGSP